MDYHGSGGADVGECGEGGGSDSFLVLGAKEHLVAKVQETTPRWPLSTRLGGKQKTENASECYDKIISIKL